MPLVFEWDPRKARANWRKHRVSFEEAHAGYEARYNLIGLSSRRLLFIVYTEPEGDAIRSISARKAEKKQRRIYEQQS